MQIVIILIFGVLVFLLVKKFLQYRSQDKKTTEPIPETKKIPSLVVSDNLDVPKTLADNPSKNDLYKEDNTFLPGYVIECKENEMSSPVNAMVKEVYKNDFKVDLDEQLKEYKESEKVPYMLDNNLTLKGSKFEYLDA